MGGIFYYLYSCYVPDTSFSIQIEAHIGNVNDLAFSKPYDEFFVISCGDDKLIQVRYMVIMLMLVIKMNPDFANVFPKVWDAATGAKQYTFEGHGAPVYSLCPNSKKNVHVRECNHYADLLLFLQMSLLMIIFFTINRSYFPSP